jgi:replicative superfamily II helicase
MLLTLSDTMGELFYLRTQGSQAIENCRNASKTIDEDLEELSEKEFFLEEGKLEFPSKTLETR